MTSPVFASQRHAADLPTARFLCLCHHSGARFVLPPQGFTFLVGRGDPEAGHAPEVDLRDLDVARVVSRRHALLFRLHHGCVVREEAKVRNGTFVNGRRLAYGELGRLRDGDLLRIANIELSVVLD